MREQLAQLNRTQTLIQELRRRLSPEVSEARAAGATWKQIGEALGMSKQAAQRRFGGARPDVEDLPLSDPLFYPLFHAPQE